MISLTINDNVIKFTFSDNDHYLKNGTIEAPLNSLTLATDDTDMFAFKKAASNDIFICGLYSEIGKTKSELETYYKENMVGSTGGGGGSTADTEALKGMIQRDLTSIDIPSGTTAINYPGFSGCTSLTSVTIPDSVTTIADSAFRRCSGLTSIDIPSGVTSIGNWSFGECLNLSSATIPDSVTFIGSYAFSNTKLNSVEIKSGVTLSNNVFSNNTDLTSAIINCEDTSSYTFQNCSNLSALTVGDNVKTIGDYAFANCSGLTSVDIPSGVTSIGSTSFAYCANLTSVTIPDSVTSIGNSTFSGCKKLKRLNSDTDGVFVLPTGVSNIGSSCFDTSGMTSLIIPSNISNIGSYAFNNCANLETITSYSVTPPSLYNAGVFYGCTHITTYGGDGKIYVPAESVDAYKAAKGWSSFADKIQAIPE